MKVFLKVSFQKFVISNFNINENSVIPMQFNRSTVIASWMSFDSLGMISS